MKLSRLFPAVALAAGITAAQAGGNATVNIGGISAGHPNTVTIGPNAHIGGNVIINGRVLPSGALPGTYGIDPNSSSRQLVPVDPRTGRPLGQQQLPGYGPNLYGGSSAHGRSSSPYENGLYSGSLRNNGMVGSAPVNPAYGSDDEVESAPRVLKFKTKMGDFYCHEGVLSARPGQLVNSFCQGIEGRVAVLNHNPLSNKTVLRNGNEAFCRTPMNEKDIAVSATVPANGKMDCLIVQFARAPS